MDWKRSLIDLTSKRRSIAGFSFSGHLLQARGAEAVRVTLADSGYVFCREDNLAAVAVGNVVAFAEEILSTAWTGLAVFRKLRGHGRMLRRVHVSDLRKSGSSKESIEAARLKNRHSYWVREVAKGVGRIVQTYHRLPACVAVRRILGFGGQVRSLRKSEQRRSGGCQDCYLSLV